MVLGCISDPQTRTNYYRTLLPWSHYRRAGYHQNFNIKMLTNNLADSLLMVDVLYLSNPSGPKHLEAIKTARQFGVPVWVDMDHNPFEIPMYHPAAPFLKKADVRQAIATCISSADQVTVAHPGLAEEFLKLNPSTLHIETGVDERVFNLAPNLDHCYHQPIVFWAEDYGHTGDLLAYDTEIREVGAKYDLTWNFVGSKNTHWALSHYLQSSVVSVFEGITELHRHLNVVKPAFIVLPLANEVYNHTADCTAYFDAMVAGATVIAPNLPQWRKVGVLLYENRTDFCKTLTMGFDMFTKGKIAQMQRNNAERMSYAVQKLHLDEINRKRQAILGRWYEA